MTRDVVASGYGVILAAFVVYEVIALVRPGVPTLGDGAARLGRSRGRRWAVLVGWLWIGWHLFVRSTFH